MSKVGPQPLAVDKHSAVNQPYLILFRVIVSFSLTKLEDMAHFHAGGMHQDYYSRPGMLGIVLRKVRIYPSGSPADILTTKSHEPFGC